MKMLKVGSVLGVAIGGFAFLAACGGSSVSDADKGADSGSTAKSDGGAEGGIPGLDLSACEKASDCMASQVCCGSINLSAGLVSVCQAGACPAIPVLNTPIQFCANTAECPAGDSCAGPPVGAAGLLPGLPSIRICLPPFDGGTFAFDAGQRSDAGLPPDAGPSPDAGPPPIDSGLPDAQGTNSMDASSSSGNDAAGGEEGLPEAGAGD